MDQCPVQGESKTLNTKEIRDKRWLYGPLGSERTSNDERVTFAIVNKLVVNRWFNPYKLNYAILHSAIILFNSSPFLDKYSLTL